MSTSDAIGTRVGADEARDAAEVATRALEYLKRHHCLSLATDGAEGLWAATVFYVNDGFTLHFLSLSDTRHVRNIESNPLVAATIGDDAESWPEIGGIQLEGKAVRVDDPDERRRVLAHFAKQYPFADSLWWTDPPPSPRAERRVYRIEPTRVLFLDHAFRAARVQIAARHLRGTMAP
jgi:uncharacterized protein YhbP (UPF0306 family)